MGQTLAVGAEGKIRLADIKSDDRGVALAAFSVTHHELLAVRPGDKGDMTAVSADGQCLRVRRGVDRGNSPRLDLTFHGHGWAGEQQRNYQQTRQPEPESIVPSSCRSVVWFHCLSPY